MSGVVVAAASMLEKGGHCENGGRRGGGPLAHAPSART